MLFLHTRAAIHKTAQDFKKIGNIFLVFSNIFSILIPFFAILQRKPIVVVNVLLLTLSIALTFISIFCIKIGKKSKSKLKRIKLVFRGFNITFSMYGFCLSGGNISNISSIISILITITWILEVLISIITYAIEKQLEYFIQGFIEDIKNIPILNDIVTNGLQREPNFTQEKTKEIKELETIIDKHKQEWVKAKKEKHKINKEKNKQRRKIRAQEILKKLNLKNNQHNTPQKK